MKPLAGISYDRLGSIICEKKGTSERPRIMLAGHMDEVGFLVKQITKEGFIKFIPVGGWWPHVILGHRVIVQTRKGPVDGRCRLQAPAPGSRTMSGRR